MRDVALELSRRLRDPDGEYKCDLIIALTHARCGQRLCGTTFPCTDALLAQRTKCLHFVSLIKTASHFAQDIQLAKELIARPSPDPTQHGVDLLLGGHDHLYFVSKGVAAWDGYVIGSESLGAEQDDGVYVIKSGSDFRDLSDIELVLEATPEGSVRRRIIKEIKGKCLHLIIRFLLYFKREAMGYNTRLRVL